MPLTIGKLDLHYTAEGVYGTLLLWDDTTRELDAERRAEFIYALLDEVAQPMGVPNEYVVEFFAPTLEHYEVFHNVGLVIDGDDDLDDDLDDHADEDTDDDGDEDELESALVA